MRLAKPTKRPLDQGGILAVILVYAMFSGGWILVSDKVVQIIFSDPNQIILVSMLKGWLYIGMSSALLYGMMRRGMGGGAPAQAGAAVPRRHFLMPAVVILVFTGLGMFNTFTHHKEAEVARLQVIADLKTRQIADWLGARQSDADFVQTSEFFAEHYRRRQESGDPRAGEQLQTRLEQFILNRGFNAVTLLKPNGERLWGSAKSPQVLAPDLQAAAQRAEAGREWTPA
jgi:hypothetical protein